MTYEDGQGFTEILKVMEKDQLRISMIPQLVNQLLSNEYWTVNS